MSIISNLWRRNSGLEGQRKINGKTFYPMGSLRSSFQKYSENELLAAAINVPELNMVLSWRAGAISNGRIQVVDKKTGKQVVNNVSKLLDKPNWFQSYKEFIIQTQLLRDIFGNEYTYGLRPVGMEPKSLFALFPQDVEIEVNSREPYIQMVEKPEMIYKTTIGDKVIGLSADDVIHLNDNRVTSTTNGIDDSLFKGISKINSVIPNVENIYAAYDARGNNLRNMGALGIFSAATKDANGAIPMQEEDKEEVQKEMAGYGVSSLQWKFLFTRFPIDYKQVSTDIHKLKTFEEVEADANTIADEYGLGSHIFSYSGSTYENKKESTKGAYQNTIMPIAGERDAAFNNYFGTENQSWHIITTFDHLPIFQEDLSEKANVVTQMTSALSTAYADGAISLEFYTNELTKLYNGKTNS